MSEEKKINWNNLRCLYAEDLHNNRVTMTIGAVRSTPNGAKLFCQTGESEAWDIAFDKPGQGGENLLHPDPETEQFRQENRTTAGLCSGLRDRSGHRACRQVYHALPCIVEKERNRPGDQNRSAGKPRIKPTIEGDVNPSNLA